MISPHIVHENRVYWSDVCVNCVYYLHYHVHLFFYLIFYFVPFGSATSNSAKYSKQLHPCLCVHGGGLDLALHIREPLLL